MGSGDEEIMVSPIASPLANEKNAKKLLKLVKSASKAKCIRRGVKEVVKAVRKGEEGLCIIAGNISPIDVISHLPVLCEEKSVTYVYVPSKEELGAASQTKRPTSVVLVKPSEDADVKEKYAECLKKCKSLH